MQRTAATPSIVPKPAGLPAVGGAYVLAIDLRHAFPLALPGRAAVVLAPGRYLYMGSANGPGGIRARVGRHVKSTKTVRWHVDRLTIVAGVSQVLAVPGGSECDLTAAALALPGATVPAPGFGASDCPSCPAHLVRVDENVDVAVFAAGRPNSAVWCRVPITEPRRRRSGRP